MKKLILISVVTILFLGVWTYSNLERKDSSKQTLILFLESINERNAEKCANFLTNTPAYVNEKAIAEIKRLYPVAENEKLNHNYQSDSISIEGATSKITNYKPEVLLQLLIPYFDTYAEKEYRIESYYEKEDEAKFRVKFFQGNTFFVKEFFLTKTASGWKIFLIRYRNSYLDEKDEYKWFAE